MPPVFLTLAPVVELTEPSARPRTVATSARAIAVMLSAASWAAAALSPASSTTLTAQLPSAFRTAVTLMSAAVNAAPISVARAAAKAAGEVSGSYEPASTRKPKDTLFVVGGGGGMFGSVKVIWVIGLLPPPAGVVLYEHVGGNGGGIEGGGNGGADGGWQCPSQSIM